MFHFPLHLYTKVVQYYCLSGGNTNYSTIFPFLSHSDMHKSDLKLVANVSIINFSLFTRRFRVVHTETSLLSFSEFVLNLVLLKKSYLYQSLNLHFSFFFFSLYYLVFHLFPNEYAHVQILKLR